MTSDHETDAVRIRDLAFRYGNSEKEPVLEGVSFNVADGEFVSIVGPSGCGKTTLLNCICGFNQPSHGEIQVYGQAVHDVVAGRAAFMFARDTLLPWRTAEGNVELAIRLREKRRPRTHRVSRTAIAAEARELMGRVGLGGFEEYPIEELSHGMRQRVALARTLAISAPLILMDEPFGALDAQTRIVMQNEFLSVWDTYRRSVVLITHDVAEAIVMSDRVIVLGGAPATVLADISVQLPRPRDPVAIHSTHESAELFKSIWAHLREAASPRLNRTTKGPS